MKWPIEKQSKPLSNTVVAVCFSSLCSKYVTQAARLTCRGPTVRFVHKNYPSPGFTCSTLSSHVWLYTATSSINAALNSPKFVSSEFTCIFNAIRVVFLLIEGRWNIYKLDLWPGLLVQWHPIITGTLHCHGLCNSILIFATLSWFFMF